MMFTEMDEYPTHQIVAPHSKVSVEDPSWTNRYYFSSFVPEGNLVLEMGIGVFPNLGLMEGWSCTVLREGGKYLQYNIRPSSLFHGSPWPLCAGPLSLEVVQPLRHWRISLDDNPYGVTYELDLEWSGQPFEADPMLLRKPDGRVITHTTHYVQMGRGRGVTRIEGQEYRLEGLVAFRDRSWGIRSPGEGGPRRGLLTWTPMDFGEEGLCYYLLEREDGSTAYLSGGLIASSGRKEERLTAVRHDLEFEPGTKIFRAGRLSVSLPQGRSLDISVKKLVALYLKGGGYHHAGHGVKRTAEHIEGEKWDLSTLERQQELLALNDNISEFHLSDGRKGYGVFELSVGRYPRYGFES